MVKLNVKIVSMQDADKFNKICSKFDCDMDLQSGKYYVTPSPSWEFSAWT